MGVRFKLGTDSLCFKATPTGGHKIPGDALDASMKKDGGTHHGGVVAPTNALLTISCVSVPFIFFYGMHAGVEIIGL